MEDALNYVIGFAIGLGIMGGVLVWAAWLWSRDIGKF